MITSAQLMGTLDRAEILLNALIEAYNPDAPWATAGIYKQAEALVWVCSNVLDGFMFEAETVTRTFQVTPDSHIEVTAGRAGFMGATLFVRGEIRGTAEVTSLGDFVTRGWTTGPDGIRRELQMYKGHHTLEGGAVSRLRKWGQVWA